MQFVILLVLILITELLRPVPKPPKRPGLGDFSAPTASQDRPIPYFWGKPWLEGPNVVWYGDLFLSKITVKIKGLFTSKKQTIGYRTHVGMHLVFGRGNANTKLLALRVGKDRVWSGTLGSGTANIDLPYLWGGDEERGGLIGSFTFMPGGPSQGQNAYLASVLGSRVPAFRGVAGLTWNRGQHGVTTVLEPWAAQLQHLPDGLASGYASINGEANAAEMQYELMTDSNQGLGLLPSEIDVVALRACAQKLHAEGLGLSLIWDNTKSLEDMMKEIDRHVESITFQDPLSGLWTMRLIRDDYSTDGLLHATPSNAQVLSFGRPSGDELVNEVKVVYSAAELDGKATPVQVQDLAAFWNRERQKISVISQYPGFTTEDLAKKAANRDLRSLSYPFARLTLKVNRQFSRIRPVDRIILDWPVEPLNITNMVLLVVERDMGTVANGEITLTCVQDVFGVGAALYSEGNSSGWAPISRTPLAPTNYRMEFTPYWALLTDPEIPQPTSAVPMTLVESPSSSHLGYLADYSDPALGGVMVAGTESQPFTPTAVLAYDYLESSSADTSATMIVKDLKGQASLTAATLNEMRYQGIGLMIVDSEWLSFTGVTARADGTYALTSVQRALLDTVPARHLAGAKVWFVGYNAGRTPTELYPFAAGTYSARIRTQALAGILDVGSSPLLTLTSNGGNSNARPLYAYPPRQFALNGSRVPTKVTGTSMALTWVHSNKELETFIYLHDDAAPAKPADTTYNVYLYDDTNVLKHSLTGLTGTSTTILQASVSGGFPLHGYVQIETVNPAGISARATIWFALDVDYANAVDAAPQRLLDEAAPWTFLRMAD